MPVLFSRQGEADSEDTEGLSEWRLLARKSFILVFGIPVLGAETLRQFVLE